MTQPRRVAFIQALHGVDLFSKGHYDEAINIFLKLDINPAKVVALYPEVISGRMRVPQEEWIALFGGKKPQLPKKSSSVDSGSRIAVETGTDVEPTVTEGSGMVSADNTTTNSSSDETASASTTEATPTVVEVTASEIPATPSEPDIVINHLLLRLTVPKTTAVAVRVPGSEKEAVETLLRYLSDRRPTLSGALGALGITPAQAHLHPTLSSNEVASLLALPDGIPIGSLVPEQLLRFAQIVDTALFKSYLVIRPRLVGSLCRIDNWCEVQEVEEELRAREVR